MTEVATHLRVWIISRASGESAALSDELRAQGAEVLNLTFPSADDPSPPTGPGLSGLAASLGAALREAIDGVDISELESAIGMASPAPDAVLFLEADVALRVQPVLRSRLGSVRQIGVEPHLGHDTRWADLKAEVVTARDQGGVLSGLGQSERMAEGQGPHLLIATHGLEVSWVDSLLLQLSIASLDDHPMIFLPSGNASVDDQLKRRAAFYGLEGQRPSLSGDLEGWVRGARLVIGRPSDRQTVTALSSGVPLLFVGDLDEDSGESWAVIHGPASHARAPVEVSVALERCLSETAPTPMVLGGVAQAAAEVRRVLRAVVDEASVTSTADDRESLEPIGRAASEPRTSPDHDRLEIDDALAQLKRQMGLNDVEG